MSWLDQYLIAIRQIRSASVTQTPRAAINFVGAGVSVTDDQAHDQTTITIAGGGAGGPFRCAIPIQAVAGAQITASETPIEIGAFALNPGDYAPSGGGLTRSFRFRAILETNDATNTAHLELFDVTSASTVATLTTGSLTPSLVVATISPASALRVYSLRLWASSSSAPPLPVVCKNAEISVVYS